VGSKHDEMADNIQLKLITIIKKKESDNWIQRNLKGALTVVLLPFISVFGLLAIFFALAISVFQKRENFDRKLIEEPWTILTESNGVKILKKYKGEIRFGPLYFALKTEPRISDIENKMFGDWFYPYRHGFLLQEWNDVDTPKTTLTYLDVREKRIFDIQCSIDSVVWDIVEREDKKLELKCDTGDRIIKYELDL
jgi:hypothetical protein